LLNEWLSCVGATHSVNPRSGVASVRTLGTPRGEAIQPGDRITDTDIVRTTLLFVATALAEIVGCYLSYLWLRRGKSALALIPAAVSLRVIAWVLTLHPTAAGRVYAAYGGVYVTVALAWLWIVDGMRPAATDYLGVALSLAGMAVIMFAPRS
jgi:small multidrug resistance family-3 protein